MNKVWYCLIVYQFLFFLVGEIKPNVRLNGNQIHPNVKLSKPVLSLSKDQSLTKTLSDNSNFILSPFDELRVTNGLNSNVRLSKPALSLSKGRSLTENLSDNSNFNLSHFDELRVTNDLNSNVRPSKPALSLSKDRSLTENLSDNSNFNLSPFDELRVTNDLNSNFRLSLSKPDDYELSHLNELSVTIANNDTIKVNNTIYIFKHKEISSVQTIDFNPLKRKIYYERLFLVTALTSASIAVVHTHQSKAWWQGTRTKFHFQNDWEYALWIDKLGHWWGATAIQHLFSSALSWSNFSYETSMWLGSALALTYQLYVETYDGYAKDWGFSPGDAMFDFGGAFYPLLQYYFPPLKNVNLKLSYYPSRRLLKKDPNDELYKNKFVIDDYEGQSFYLSFKINNMLPERLEKFWPDFLCLAIGYQMRNWNGYAVADKNYFLTLDYDFEQIPLYGQFWQFLKNTFNLIHFPAPGIKYSNKKFYLTITY